MIPPDTIRSIIDTARIEEVVGDFVRLRRAGSNLVGLCPFHQEKTPSFSVSVSRGIYKCFGCGKAGNVVNFIMEHEKYSYVEALRYLGKRYNIPIVEEELTSEAKQKEQDKESLFNLNDFALKYFLHNLNSTDEGKSVGLQYLRERGIRDDIFKKFQIGYCLDGYDGFSNWALQNGYRLEQLKKSGLTKETDHGLYDFFRGRIIFPIHNISGRIIGFAGRVLTSDKTKAKYINSPESEIYFKSQVLYGINFAKSALISKDNCYLVEGYTDVISLHQAGVENVVASSGTSLTIDQIKIIRRYTPNITILYDGDAAGIKASFRGIDMLLEQGMNVKIVLFPDGEDPDSFARKHTSTEVIDFITGKSENFILFKTHLLLKETGNDPIKKSQLIQEIVSSVALMPDQISRSVYIKECAEILEIPEQTLMNQLNKVLRKNFDNKRKDDHQAPHPEIVEALQQPVFIDQIDPYSTIIHERDLIRLLLLYGSDEVVLQERDPEKFLDEIKTHMAPFLIEQINQEQFEFTDSQFQDIFNEYQNALMRLETPDEKYFLHHSDSGIANFTINLTSEPYQISDWSKIHIQVKTERDRLAEAVNKLILNIKLRMIKKHIDQVLKEIKNEPNPENIEILLERKKFFDSIFKEIGTRLDRIIT